MDLVIIAGGKGTRLGFKDIPKPMVKLDGKPLLEHQINLAKRYGIANIFILSGHLSEVIVDYFGDGSDWGVKITHVIEDNPLGTSGAVKQLDGMLTDRFVVFYGDTVVDVNLDALIKCDAKHKNSLGTLVVHPNDHPSDSDLIESDSDGRVLHFHSKPHDARRYYFNLVNAAMYLLSPEIFKFIPEGVASDFGKHIFPEVIKSANIYTYNTTEYIKDMGTLDRLKKVEKDIQSGKVTRRNLSNRQKALFIDRDGVINKEVDNLSDINQFELIEQSAAGIRIINKSDYISVVVTNQPMIAKGFLSIDGLNEIHKKMDTQLGEEGAFIDRLYYCPHHPENGFTGEVPELKIKCDCRKPETGLVEKAVAEMNIDLSSSWMIGDSTTDLLLAQNSGMRSVLVETGHAGLDGKHAVYPDFTLPDLYHACDFIINSYDAMLENALKFVEGFNKGSMIFLGGHSRSGKSNVASVLKDAFFLKGERCVVLQTDRWLLSEPDRGLGVLAKHHMKNLSDVCEKLLANDRGNISLTLPHYRKSDKQSLSDQLHVDIKNTDIVIMEGVVALYLAKMFGAVNRFWILCEENERKSRFISEYIRRGMTMSEADQLYFNRKEEYSFVEMNRSSAKILQL